MECSAKIANSSRLLIVSTKCSILFDWLLNMPLRTLQQNIYSQITSTLLFVLLSRKYDRYSLYNSRQTFTYLLVVLIVWWLAVTIGHRHLNKPPYFTYMFSFKHLLPFLTTRNGEVKCQEIFILRFVPTQSFSKISCSAYFFLNFQLNKKFQKSNTNDISQNHPHYVSM